jgi:hypothetical protein
VKSLWSPGVPKAGPNSFDTSRELFARDICEFEKPRSPSLPTDLRAGQKVLDVAAGNGNVTLAVAALVRLVEPYERTGARPLAIPLRTSESWRPSVAGYEHARGK